MNIVSTVTTRTAQEQTEHANYSLEYVVNNSTLERVQATVFETSSTLAEGAAPQFIGTITYERGNVYCSLPFAPGIAQFVSDFEGYLTGIISELPAPTEENYEENHIR